MVVLIITNGRVIDPANNIDGQLDVIVEDGRVTILIAHFQYSVQHSRCHFIELPTVSEFLSDDREEFDEARRRFRV